MELLELIYSWEETKGVGNQAQELVKDFYFCFRDVEEVVDVSSRQEYYVRGDLLVRKRNREGELVEILSEVKGDRWTARTGNIFIETVGAWQRGYPDQPGWIITSEADFLDYYSTGDDVLYHFQMQPLKEWFGSVRYLFSERLTGGSKSLYGTSTYQSKGALVSLDFLLNNFKEVRVYKNLKNFIKKNKKE